jgi:hypothetical protein
MSLTRILIQAANCLSTRRIFIRLVTFEFCGNTFIPRRYVEFLHEPISPGQRGGKFAITPCEAQIRSRNRPVPINHEKSVH